MKKTLLLVGALCVLGTTAFGATSIGSEVRAIDYKNGTDKTEYTIANGSTDVAENVKFYFDVDLDTEYNSSNRDKFWDTDWRIQYNVPQEVLGHNLAVSYELDYDYDHDVTVEDSTQEKHEVRFAFSKDNYTVAPMVVNNGITDETYLELDVYIYNDAPLGMSFDVYSYNYFGRDGHGEFDTDLEMYLYKKVPFHGINLKPSFGFEGYGLINEEASENLSVYAQLRIDKTFEIAEGFKATPYVAYTNYNGDWNETYTEFGIETSVKF